MTEQTQLFTVKSSKAEQKARHYNESRDERLAEIEHVRALLAEVNAKIASGQLSIDRWDGNAHFTLMLFYIKGASESLLR